MKSFSFVFAFVATSLIIAFFMYQKLKSSVMAHLNENYCTEMDGNVVLKFKHIVRIKPGIIWHRLGLKFELGNTRSGKDIDIVIALNNRIVD